MGVCEAVMPWHESHTVPFSHLGVVSSVPSEGGVFGILSGAEYLLISESWNLKARLLDLISILNGPEHLEVIYELCPETERQKRAEALKQESLEYQRSSAASNGTLPGIRFWANPPSSFDHSSASEAIES